jgi:MoaA/NifB/PqqE/SkfB family radical SAM enzyme
MHELSRGEKLAVADNIAESGVLSVNLGGGEPFMCPDVPAVVKRLSSQGVLVELATSGWQVSETQVEQVAENGLSCAYFSIDDIRPQQHDALRGQQGCFASCLRVAEQFRARGIQLICSTVVTSSNFEVLDDIVELAVSLGCRGIELKRLRLHGNARSRSDLELSSDQVDELYERVATWKQTAPLDIVCIYGARRVEGIDEGCPCGRSVLALMPDGGIAPCVYAPKIIGNALTDHIDDIWNSSSVLDRMRQSQGCVALGEGLEHAL